MPRLRNTERFLFSTNQNSTQVSLATEKPLVEKENRQWKLDTVSWKGETV